MSLKSYSNLKIASTLSKKKKHICMFLDLLTSQREEWKCCLFERLNLINSSENLLETCRVAVLSENVLSKSAKTCFFDCIEKEENQTDLEKTRILMK